jgi:hypothetical protein
LVEGKQQLELKYELAAILVLRARWSMCGLLRGIIGTFRNNPPQNYNIISPIKHEFGDFGDGTKTPVSHQESILLI